VFVAERGPPASTMDTPTTSQKRPFSSPLNAEARQPTASVGTGASLRLAFYARQRLPPPGISNKEAVTVQLHTTRLTIINHHCKWPM